MVKLNKKKGRRSGKRIQYNLARKSLKKKSKRNNKSKKLLIGGFMSKKTNQYDNGATISFNITNTCGGETQTQTLRFKSQDNMRDLTKDDDKKNFVLLKHRVLDEKPLTTSSFKTPLYAAYFKIPKIIFSLCKQKSKGDKNNLKLTVQYNKTGKLNSFDISHNCTPSKFGNMNNMVKNQVETDANNVKEAFKTALENHTSYNDQISAFLSSYKDKLSEETVKIIKNKYGSNEEYVKEAIKKAAIKAVEDVLKKRETHVVKEECDETKQLLKGMSIIINPDGSVQFNKSGENTEKDMHKVINDINRGINMTKKLNSEAGIVIAESEKNESSVKTQSQTKEDAENTVKGAAKGVVEKKVEEQQQGAISDKTTTNAAKDAAAEVALSNEVKNTAEKKVTELVKSTSSNEVNVEKNVKDVKYAAEKKVTEELVKAAAIKAVEQAVKA